MRTSTLAWMVIIVLVLAGGAWYYTNMNIMQVAPSPEAAGTVPEGSGQMVDASDNPVGGPSGAAGINGSANQGNLGQPDTGVVQKPMEDGAEGSIIGSNVALGTNSDAKLGTYLIAYNGMTLYLYTKDTGKESTCYDQCATNWPPYVVGAEDNVKNVKLGVSADKVGTVLRKDGSIQVTYDGHPLYFWKNDKKSGDATGQNVGGVWFVLKP